MYDDIARLSFMESISIKNKTVTIMAEHRRKLTLLTTRYTRSCINPSHREKKNITRTLPRIQAKDGCIYPVTYKPKNNSTRPSPCEL
jgi:hypothetical protein